MKKLFPSLSATFLAAILTAAAFPATAAGISGKREIVLHGRDGSAVVVGHVVFSPRGERSAFAIEMDHARFQDFFLSMKEFKCIETTSEVFCHVPYPHAHPATVATDDYAWLEHSLLFMYKSPQEFGAKLWNGIYYRLQAEGDVLVGTPQAVDLNQIGAPPADPSRPPYPASERAEVAAGSRWFGRLSIR